MDICRYIFLTCDDKIVKNCPFKKLEDFSIKSYWTKFWMNCLDFFCNTQLLPKLQGSEKTIHRALTRGSHLKRPARTYFVCWDFFLRPRYLSIDISKKKVFSISGESFIDDNSLRSKKKCSLTSQNRAYNADYLTIVIAVIIYYVYARVKKT